MASKSMEIHAVVKEKKLQDILVNISSGLICGMC